MFKKILVTIDPAHKPSWELALPKAVELAKASGGVVHVLAVVPEVPSALVAGFLPKGFETDAVKDAKTLVAKIAETEIGSSADYRVHVVLGVVHDEILKAIGRFGADLVVMASHSPDRVREFLVGSQADRVVRRSPVSVLVVRG
ncbi:universal stress protein [Hoeflea sp. YIM 152468]|uniref:universal stress protein n=1 Tax=Hoeflea sp. YIM 152468 TaxID=3031759 RepID=UPI0023DBA0C1|nr:universal stress protein [Hoeflea sp. YIM 152468]MDF1608166.1 universal stress protein [Hoeflea sp. YIM 152468]